MEAVMEEPPKAAAPAHKVTPLDAARMKECEFERTVWVITAHENTGPEDLLKHEYWTNVAEKLKPWDKIEARADDGSWYAEFVVLEAERLWARTALLNLVDLNTAKQSDAKVPQSEFSVQWKGPARKWSVIRNSDSQPVFEGQQTRASCDAWIVSRMKAGV